jgi:hypothetical protein
MKPELLRIFGVINGALIAALVLIAGSEAYLRLTIPASSGESIYRYTLETRRYKVMKPNVAVSAWGKELRTNELGFRDNSAAIPPKQPDEFRIIVLGSSFTVSAGVDYADIYTSRLEQQLRKIDPKVKVINLAVGGYNPLQYELVLKEVGLSLDPDMVLVALFPDSDFRLDIYEENRRVAEGKAPEARPSAWDEHLYTYRAYGRRIADKVKSILVRPSGQSSDFQARRAWLENTAALQRIAQTARERKLPLAVAVLPHTFNFIRQREEFGRIQRFCREQQLPCLNLLESFIARQVPEGQLRLNVLDSHPNEKYNAIVANVLTSELGPVLPALKDRDSDWASAATVRRAEFQR